MTEPSPAVPLPAAETRSAAEQQSDAGPPVCSARGCRTPAVWALKWNNPRLHDAGRRKTWLACATHRDTLGGFLDARGFLREVEPGPASLPSTRE